MCRAEDKEFTLALPRLAPYGENESSPIDMSVAHVAERIREAFGQDVVSGRYGLNSLVVYHAGGNVDEIQQVYASMAQEVSERFSMHTAVGIAPYPYLGFRKTDVLENCRKALEYAQLLPRPHVGVFDSLALNISADKRFSQGDAFGAIKEYKTALLADGTNTLAWNSLGVSLASLGKYGEAEECFRKAFSAASTSPIIWYTVPRL